MASSLLSTFAHNDHQMKWRNAKNWKVFLFLFHLWQYQKMNLYPDILSDIMWRRIKRWNSYFWICCRTTKSTWPWKNNETTLETTEKHFWARKLPSRKMKSHKILFFLWYDGDSSGGLYFRIKWDVERIFFAFNLASSHDSIISEMNFHEKSCFLQCSGAFQKATTICKIESW